MSHAWADDDPVARDAHGAALSAGELCQRDGCWHRWLDHDHIDAGLSDAAFGWCMILGTDGRCHCLGFVSKEPPVVPPTPFAVPPPGPPR